MNIFLSYAGNTSEKPYPWLKVYNTYSVGSLTDKRCPVGYYCTGGIGLPGRVPQPCMDGTYSTSEGLCRILRN